MPDSAGRWELVRLYFKVALLQIFSKQHIHRAHSFTEWYCPIDQRLKHANQFPFLLQRRNSTKYNEKLESAYIKAYYRSKKKKNTRKLEKAEEVCRRKGRLQLRDLILPPRSYMPITQAAKETQLEPGTVEGKMQGVGNWGAFSKHSPAAKQRRWWRRIFLLTYQSAGMNRACFGFWLKEGETPFPLGGDGVLFWTCASCAHTLLL